MDCADGTESSISSSHLCCGHSSLPTPSSHISPLCGLAHSPGGAVMKCRGAGRSKAERDCSDWYHRAEPLRPESRFQRFPVRKPPGEPVLGALGTWCPTGIDSQHLLGSRHCEMWAVAQANRFEIFQNTHLTPWWQFTVQTPLPAVKVLQLKLLSFLREQIQASLTSCAILQLWTGEIISAAGLSLPVCLSVSYQINYCLFPPLDLQEKGRSTIFFFH